MSGRFVRASKYRHVHGKEAKHGYKIKQDANLSVESFGAAASSKFYVTSGRGGGCPLNYVPVVGPDEPGQSSSLKWNCGTKKPFDLAFSPFMPSVLAVGADAGVIYITKLDPEVKETKSQTSLAELTGVHRKKMNQVRWNSVANNVLAAASHDKKLSVWDVQNQAPVMSWGYDDGKYTDCKSIKAIAWSQHGDMLSVANDLNVHILDPRDPDGSLTVVDYSSKLGPKPRHMFWIDQNTVGLFAISKTVSRVVQVYDIRADTKTLYETPIDQASGTLSPYYDPDTKVLFAAGKGDNNVRYWEWDSDQTKLFFLSEFRGTSSSKGVAYAPKRVCDIGHCEIQRMYRQGNQSMAQVAFMVPRKSDMFQEDIYPDCLAGKPGIEAAPWIEGKNGEPVRMSMNPAERKDADEEEATFEAAASPAELRAENLALKQELEAAKKRIAELEAQISS